jgi:hypothetical protein
MRTLIGTALLLTALWTAAPAAAQSGGLPMELVSAKQALTPDQKKRVEEAVDAAARKFADGKPAEVVDGRNALIDIARNPLAGEVFRHEFAIAVVKRLEGYAKPATGLQATNAFLVARFLGASEGVDFLVTNIDVDSQPDASLRVAAAAQLSKAIGAAPLSGPQLDAIAKRIVNAAKDEKSWIALAHDAEAVGDMLRQRGLPAAQADAIALSEAAIVNDIAERFLKGGNPELMLALQRGLLMVRNQMTAGADAGRGKLLPAIAPTLDKLAALKANPPAEVTERKQLAPNFAAMMNTVGLLQKLVSTGGRPA